jgi:hypothetical protein
MRLVTLALASSLALSGTFALAHGYKHHHHMRHSMNMMRGPATPTGQRRGRRL